MNRTPLSRWVPGTLLALAVAVGGLVPSDHILAQGGPGADSLPGPAQTGVDDPNPPEPISPGGAFLRSVLVPGWGHVATESFGRGGFYVASQAGAVWMLWKSSSRRREALRFGRVERDAAAVRLRMEGIVDPDSLRFAVEEDPEVQGWDDLAETRASQVEDWIVTTAFLVLLGAADAYVTAHFLDSPEPLSFRIFPGRPGEGIEFGISVPVGGTSASGARR